MPPVGMPDVGFAPAHTKGDETHEHANPGQPRCQTPHLFREGKEIYQVGRRGRQKKPDHPHDAGVTL
jgi:hypothetical protein